mmetsp:Transcript_10037/g.27400  ORF Transcript_10037/g.27400 Transcript_10037/m.27400 type:complete len:315 (+) Transcript_10037:12745-13689(+)
MLDPRVCTVNVERATPDGRKVGGAQLVVAHVHVVRARSGGSIEHLVSAVVHVHHARNPLALAIHRNDLNGKRVATCGALLVLCVFRLNDKRHLHPIHALGQQARAIGQAIARGGVGKVVELDLVHGPALSIDGYPDVHSQRTVHLVVGGVGADGLIVNQLAIHNNLILLTGAKLDLDVPRFEAQALHHQRCGAKHRPTLRMDASARIGRPNDGRHVELQGVPQPAVGPAAKQQQAAGVGIKHPCTVFSSAGDLAMVNRGCAPNLAATIHDLHGVDVLHHALFSSKAEDLVVWHRLDAVAHVAADLIWQLGRLLL